MTTPGTASEIPNPADPADRPALDRPGSNSLAAAAVRGAFAGAARAGFTWLIELIQEHVH